MIKIFKIAVTGIIYYLNYHFTMVKFFLEKPIKISFLLNVLSLMLTVIYVLLNSLIVAVCVLYKLLVWTLLKLYYRGRFSRFVSGCGLVTTFNDSDLEHINILVTVSSSKNGDELFKEIQERIYEKFFLDQSIKRDLFCLKKSMFGYQFLISVDDITLEETFVKWEIPQKASVTEEELMHYAGKFYSSKMPRNGSFVWDLVFCTTPIITRKPVDGKTYAFLLRIGHALGDGLVIYNLLSNSFSKPDPAKDLYVKKLTQSNPKTEKMRKACPTHVVNLHRGPWKEKDLIWTDATLETGKFINVQKDCLWKIRDIRQSFPGVSFLNVVYAAYSHGFTEYFTKYHKEEMPKDIVLCAPMQINSARIEKLLVQNGKNDFNNDFSAFLITCPLAINTDNKGNPLVERLLQIQQEFERVFSSFDIQGLYIIFKIFLNTFPIPLVKLLLSRMFFGSMMSCIPGGPKVEFFEGSTVEQVSFFLPRQKCYALAVGILTYGDQMQLGITLDDAKFNNKERINTLVDGFFNYIDSLHEFCISEREIISKL